MSGDYEATNTLEETETRTKMMSIKYEPGYRHINTSKNVNITNIDTFCIDCRKKDSEGRT